MIKHVLTLIKLGFGFYMAKMKNFNDNKLGWHGINWKKINYYVSNLQKSMVVAYMHNDTVEYFRIQNKLMLSWKARALAVRNVTSKTGSKTPGVDNVVWLTHEQKYAAIDLLKQSLLAKESTYKVGLVKRVWIPKPNSSELRPLGIPTLLDRALQTLVMFALDPIVEHISDLYSFGSRKYKGTWDAMTRIRTLLDKKHSPRFIWDADISDCFGQISHEFLMNEVTKILYPSGSKLVYKWLKAGIIEKGVITFPKKGTPQGGVISPILCNITLNKLENVIRKGNLKHSNSSKLSNLRNVWVVRYVDDFVVTSPCENKLRNDIIPAVHKFLLRRGLTISESKSKIIDLNKDSLHFLGWEISIKNRKTYLNNQSKSGSDKILIVKPSKAAICNIKSSIRTIFKSPDSFIKKVYKLNLKIRGWANYYCISSHSRHSFSQIRTYTYHTWWTWVRRWHPKRSKKWIVNKYVFNDGKRKWQLGINEYKQYTIIDPTEVKIKKLRPLKSGINPYVNKEYYLKNPRIFVFYDYRDSIYKYHKYRCFVCKELLLPDEQIDLHHLIPKSEGGTYSHRNIVPVHKTCHDTITYARKK
jgi:RNA-directed DNA polymerase